MDDFVTVVDFPSGAQVEIAILRNRMESIGIDVVVLGEDFVPYYKGSSKIRFQIKKSDFEKAKPILIELGYYNKNDFKTSPFIQKFNRFTDSIPFLKKLSVEKRLFIVFVFLASMFSVIIYFYTQPTLEERLEKNSWCVEKLTYLGQDVQVKSLGMILITQDGCKERINFYKQGKIDLPGINSYASQGAWNVNDDKITISGVDKNDSIFDGVYEVQPDNRDNIILRSDHTVIYLHASRFFFPF
jgi:hypothetical protein